MAQKRRKPARSPKPRDRAQRSAGLRHAVELRKLDFAYEDSPPLFRGISLRVPEGSRTLLIGANGTGKSTLLRLIAGHHLLGQDTLHVFGRSPFYDLSLSQEVSLVEGYFPLNVDLRVSELLSAPAAGVEVSLQKELVDLLGVNPDWRMSRVSEGQRRRVQLLLTLRRPIKLLLLDEVTAHLDVVIRSDLLDWVKARSVKTGMTVIYATHIFDGLWQNPRDCWLTDLAFLKFSAQPEYLALAKLKGLEKKGASLFRLCESWIRKDIEAHPAELSRI